MKKKKPINKKKADPLFDMLFQVATSYLNNAHSPYSKVKVASACLMEDGQIYGGVNIENVSYGGTICAERVAITKAVSENHLPAARKLKAILVVTNQKEIWPPCGFCRQVMVEFGQDKTIVYSADLKKRHTKSTLGQLLPGSYSPKFLLS